MARSQNQPIKSLNKGPSGKRFVFKNFSQRLEEVDIDVFRSLAPVKFEPTQGTSFFQENLLQWRELNSAAEFISLYEELMPVVQTLPQVLLHKEMIVSKLLCRLHMQAKLSLEPILSAGKEVPFLGNFALPDGSPTNEFPGKIEKYVIE